MNRSMPATTHCSISSAFALLVLALSISLSPAPAVGQSQRHLSHQQVKALVASAKSPNDHLRLAAYYRAEATRLRKESKDHQEEAAGYANRTIYEPKGGWLQHCKSFADSFGQAADEADALAGAHQKMAEASK
jgi:hypothetical protein